MQRPNGGLQINAPSPLSFLLQQPLLLLELHGVRKD